VSSTKVPAIVLGASGYVGGELVRLLSAHPGFALAAAVSESRAGKAIAESFPHLAGAVGDARFAAAGAWIESVAGAARVAILSAAPHGASAPAIAGALATARGAGLDAAAVDLSADFRFPGADEYAAVYGHAHPEPALAGKFRCAVPEHWSDGAPKLVAHPGCFPTAALLAIVPLLELGLAEPRFAITAITGSTGSGREPSEKTHHPARRSNVAAYSPLAHRHAPEMRSLTLRATGVAPEIAFVPVSGPQARGIYLSLHATPSTAASGAEVARGFADFYAASPFVAVSTAPPSLTEVVGTNRARIGVAVAGGALSVTVAIDNLVKGAAGGAVQWLNRIHGYDEKAGLELAGLGWF
jgi:N-acetyl-gamma-glutamyl-phosphate reductase